MCPAQDRQRSKNDLPGFSIILLYMIEVKNCNSVMLDYLHLEDKEKIEESFYFYRAIFCGLDIIRCTLQFMNSKVTNNC